MAATIWKAGSGDWNDPSSWTSGVPTAADVAVFPLDGLPFGVDANGHPVVTITGSGPAAAIDVLSSANAGPYNPTDTLRFTGTHSVTAVSIVGAAVNLASTASLSFTAATLTGLSSGGSGSLLLDAGATLGNGTVSLADAFLKGSFGVLSNPLQLSGTIEINGSGTLAGAIAGTGSLTIGDQFNSSIVAVAVTGNASGYSGSVDLQGADVALAAGESGLDTFATEGATIAAASQDVLAFDRVGLLNFQNGSGHSTVVGAVGPTSEPLLEIPPQFGVLSVDGGTGRVTVFGNDDSGEILGGSAGGNVIVAGASAAGYVSTPGGTLYDGPLGAVLAPKGVTIVGGGSGDLLVATGRFASLIVAGGGNETLNGSGATGADTFFGGAGADEIAAGAGQDTIVAGSGTQTIFGSAGSTAIFAGAGSDLIVAGSGSAYIQAGRGSAALYAGSGFDQIGVVNGQSGGGMTVTGFKSGIDRIDAQGYAGGPVVTVAGGNTVLTFPDSTRITLIGVTDLPAASIV